MLFCALRLSNTAETSVVIRLQNHDMVSGRSALLIDFGHIFVVI